MNIIHSWAVGMCVAAVISAVVTGLIPSGSLEKSVKTVVAVFLLCAMILPFFKEKSSNINYLSKKFDKSYEAEEALSQEVCRQTEQYMKNTVEKILQKNGITCADVIIHIEAKDESVNVDGITVKSPDAQAETVKKIIKEELGVEAMIEE